MNDKITVEFSRKELKANCKINCPICVYKDCKRTDYDLIKCLLIITVYHKIKDKETEKKNNKITKEMIESIFKGKNLILEIGRVR